MAERDIRTVDLYMCATESTLDRREDIIERLETIQSNGAIDRFTVRTWPRHVTAGGPNEDVLSVVDRFQQWGSEAGTDFGPTFDRRRYDRSFTDESGETLTLPTVALAVYEGDDLVEVAPHADASQLQTVEDLLAKLDQQTEPPADRRVAADELT